MANRSKIVSYSRTFRATCMVGLIGIPIALGAIWIFGSEAFLRSGEPAHYLVPYGIGFDAGRLDPTLRVLGFAISMIPGAVAMWALWQLAKLFGCFAGLEFFTAETVRSFRMFATAVLLTGFVHPLAGGLMSVATTLGNSPGNRYLSFTAGDSEMTAVFLGLVLMVIAWVMEQGQRIAEENEEIV